MRYIIALACLIGLLAAPAFAQAQAVTFQIFPNFSSSSIAYKFAVAPLAGSPAVVVNKVHWDFGDNTTSEDLSPTHFYTTPQYVTVTAVVYYSCSDTPTGYSCAKATATLPVLAGGVGRGATTIQDILNRAQALALQYGPYIVALIAILAPLFGYHLVF